MGEVCSWTEIYFFENMSTLEDKSKCRPYSPPRRNIDGTPLGPVLNRRFFYWRLR